MLSTRYTQFINMLSTTLSTGFTQDYPQVFHRGHVNVEIKLKSIPPARGGILT